MTAKVDVKAATEQLDATPAATPTVDPSRAEQVKGIIKRYAGFSGVAGLVPVPLLDLAAITGIQVKMLFEIAKVHGIEFKRERAKTLIGSLLSSSLATSLSSGTMGSMIKAVPVVGQVLGIVTLPALAAASTVALGRVFNAHFESGGTLLDFDTAKMRSYYEEQFKQESAK